MNVKTLTIDLENCYGIRKLTKTIDFSKAKACAIYAPNGSMKSSLAKTFQDIVDGSASKDRIFPARTSKRVIRDEAGTDLSKEGVLVVRPYDEVLGHSEKTSTLLVNPTLRKEYETLHAEIDAAKEAFLLALKGQSASKRDLEKELSVTFTAREDQFYVALNRIKDEVTQQPDAPLAAVDYDVVFDDKVLGFLGTKDFKTAIEGYIKKYNELLAASTYFKKGTFTYYNAATIAKQLADNGFFEAKHSVNLNAGAKLEIKSQKELEDLIAKEKDAISNDKDLKKKFSEIEKLIQKNVTVRDFEAYLANHEELLVRLLSVSPAILEKCETPATAAEAALLLLACQPLGAALYFHQEARTVYIFTTREDTIPIRARVRCTAVCVDAQGHELWHGQMTTDATLPPEEIVPLVFLHAG